jgi:hypothetical protein
VIALAAFFRALHRDHIQDWIIYTVAALIAAYTYYLEIFVLAALNLSVLIIYIKDRKRLQHWFLSQVIIGMTLLPWYLILLGKLQTGLGYGGTAGSFAPDQLIFWFIPTLLFGDTVSVSQTISLVITAIIFVSWIVLWRLNWRYTLTISLLVVIPMIGLAIVSTRLNVFTPRYIMGSIPAYLIGLAAFLQLRGQKVMIAYGVIGAWFLVSLLALHNTYNNPLYQKAPDWREITGYLDSHTTPDDIVIQTGVDAAFGYYYHQTAIQAPELALPASASQQETEIIETLAALQTEYQSIWLTGKTISSWANYGVVDRWALENMQLVREQFIDGVPIRQFRNFQPESDEYGNVTVSFGDVITLVGAQIQPTDPDGTRTIWLYWRIEEQTPVSLKIFLHLSGAINPATGNPIWSQDDHFPLQGRIDSQTWQVGTIFRDIARISVQDLPTGNYNLNVGWYDPLSGSRVITDQGTDSYLLETFEVK